MSKLPGKAFRLANLPTYGFAVIGQRIQEMTAEGKDVIRLDIGSPDMPPPQPVIDALKRSADDVTHYQYGSYRGDPGFRRAVASYYSRRFGVTLDPEHEVLPLIGSKEGIVNIALAYVDHGNAAIVPDICYPAYAMGARLAGGTVLYVPLDPDNGYLPDFSAIQGDLSKAKLLWINYPNNPTGAIAPLAFYEEAIDFCRQHNLLLCSDNPYCEIVYDGYRAPSVLQAKGAMDCAVEFMSLSKTYNLAGWRIGACVGNREALDNLLTVKSNIDSGHWRSIYDASVVALTETPQSWIDARNAHYRMRRDHLLKAIPDLGLEANQPSASMYVWARVLDGDDGRYAREALEAACVALTPGTMYGPGGDGYVRFSLGMDDARFDEAINRLREWRRVKVAG